MTSPKAPSPPLAHVPAPAPATLYKALAAAGMLSPLMAHGAVVTVNTLAESAPGACGLLDAARTISTGAASGGCVPAGALTAPNTVNFAPGLSGTILLSGAHTANYGVYFNAFTNLSIVGPGASTLAITCNKSGITGAIGIEHGASANVISVSGLTVSKCAVAENAMLISTGATGNAARIEVSDMLFIDNSSDGGGALRTQVRGDVTVRNSTFTRNSAANSVSAVNIFAVGTVQLHNSTISDNKAAGSGPAIQLIGSGTEVDHSTIVYNTSGPDAALFYGNNLFERRVGQKAAEVGINKLSNSIVCGNSALDARSAGQSIATVNNWLGNAVPVSSFVGTPNVMGCSAASLSGNLGALSNNGGTTLTHALLNTGSNPAINGGQPTAPGLGSDQRGAGFQRIVGAASDIGAFEFGAGITAVEPAVAVPTVGAASLGALSLALAALGMRRRKQTKSEK